MLCFPFSTTRAVPVAPLPSRPPSTQTCAGLRGTSSRPPAARLGRTRTSLRWRPPTGCSRRRPARRRHWLPGGGGSHSRCRSSSSRRGAPGRLPPRLARRSLRPPWRRRGGHNGWPRRGGGAVGGNQQGAGRASGVSLCWPLPVVGAHRGHGGVTVRLLLFCGVAGLPWFPSASLVLGHLCPVRPPAWPRAPTVPDQPLCFDCSLWLGVRNAFPRCHWHGGSTPNSACMYSQASSSPIPPVRARDVHQPLTKSISFRSAHIPPLRAPAPPEASHTGVSAPSSTVRCPRPDVMSVLT